MAIQRDIHLIRLITGPYISRGRWAIGRGDHPFPRGDIETDLNTIGVIGNVLNLHDDR